MINRVDCDFWFPTPIWATTLDISEEDNKTLIKYCHALKKNDLGNIKSNVGGWQSKDIYVNENENREFLPYFYQILIVIQEIQKKLQTERVLKISNSWININGTGDYNKPHWHSGVILSGVFYLSDTNSKVIFHKEKNISDWMLDYISSERTSPLTARSAAYTPRKNDLYIFPSWIMHEVEPNKVKDERISIAFNVAAE